MDTVHLTLLGAPAIWRGDRSLTLVRAKGLALLLYLAVTRVAQQRDVLLDLLWPESLPQAARKNMRNTLWAIREALGDDVLELHGATIGLSPAVRVDIHIFKEGLLLLESGSVTELEAVAAQYHGSLADGLMLHEAPEFETWLTTERERVAAIYLHLLERIIALHQAAGNWQAVITYAQRTLAADPLREPIHLALIEAHVRLGQRAQAAQQFAALADILRHELDVAPLPETIARYQALLAGTPRIAAQQPHHPAPPPESRVPFVGRHAELAALDEELGRATLRTARVVLIAGDLGLGKSRLWQTWADSRAAGAVVLASHALETSEPVPFGPLLALFRQPGPARAIVEPPSPLGPIWLAELARLLPEIVATRPDLPPPLALSPAEQRSRLLHALTEALRLLADPLLVLVVDDLHWADPSTLDFLVYLIDHLQDAPLLLIGTFRPHDRSDRLTAIVAGWQRQGWLRQITLPQLALAEGHTLLEALGTAGDADTRDRWVRQSGGNPYFLIELSRTPGLDPPGDLASLVRARMRATVPEPAYQVLQAAAVLGDRVELAVLRATSGRTEEETLDALDVLVGAGVLAEQAGAYHFVHPLVAEIVMQDLTAARRAFLHRRAAQGLEQLYPHQLDRLAGPLMTHYAAGGDVGRAAHYAELAAMQAAGVGAFVEAAAYARHALGWGVTPQRQLLLGEALAVAGAVHEAQTQLEAALHSFAGADDAVGATRARTALALLAIGTGRPDEAWDWLQQAPVERAQATDPALGVQLHLLAASVHRHREAFDAAAAELDTTDRIIKTHHLLAQAGQSAFERGNLLANQGNVHAALAAFAEALQLAREIKNPISQAMAHNNLAYHAALVGELERAQQHVRDAAALAEQYALSLLWQYIHSTAGEIALAQGQLDSADTAFRDALAAAQAWDNRAHIANLRVNQARVALARSDLTQAHTFLTEAQAVFGDAVDPYVRNKIARYRAEIGQADALP
jgi:DNA-binding SARP family transcriptional activator